MKKDHTPGQQTDYKIELSKRNQYIYLKHLEGRTNGQLRNIFHLSESSIRRTYFSPVLTGTISATGILHADKIVDI